MLKTREQRRDAILREARRLFSEHGYKNTSLSMIVERTGGSRRDFYDFFGGKEGLLKQVLKITMDEVLEATAELHASPGEAPEQVLKRFGRAFIARVLGPDVIAAFREFAVIRTDHPDLGREAYEMGPAVLYRRLEAYIEAEVAAGRLSTPSPQRAARILIEAFKGEFQLKQMMGAAGRPSADEVAAHVDAVVDLFLNDQARHWEPNPESCSGGGCGP